MTASDSPPSALRVHLALVANAVMWGAAYPLNKRALEGFPTAIALALRFGLASACVLPFAWRRLTDGRALRWGAALGSIMLAIYSLLAIGLANMSAVRCAFLMGTTVVFVQVAETVRRRRVDPVEATSALASVLGIFLLTGSDGTARSLWDLVVLGAAGLSAAGLAVVHRATRAGGMAVDALTFWQLATLAGGAALGAVAAANSMPAWSFELVPTLCLVLCAVFASALAQRLQMLYQHFASQSVAAMIFALKPLFATLLTAAMFQETLAGGALAGGALMLTAAFLPPYLTWRRERAAVAET